MNSMVDMLVNLTRARMRQIPTEWDWLGFNTHQLKPLLSSAVFSAPATLYLACVRGSFGKQKIYSEEWKPSVGVVDHTRSRRDSYAKEFDSEAEPNLSVRDLWSELRTRRVKKPVVQYAYILRAGVYMLWHFRYVPRKNVVWSAEAKESAAKKDTESSFTFDIFAADTVPLETADNPTAIRQAHDEEFLYDIIRPTLLAAHGEPSPWKRTEKGQTPRHIIDAKPITLWVR